VFKIIGFDLDGTITKLSGSFIAKLKIPSWIICFALKLLRPTINKNILSLIKEYKNQGKKVIVVTSRPISSEIITKKHLRKIPFDELYFVNSGPEAWKRKVRLVRSLGIKIFYDNDERVTRELKKAGIKAVLVKNNKHYSTFSSPV